MGRGPSPNAGCFLHRPQLKIEMNYKDTLELKARLAELNAGERTKLYKRASALRRERQPSQRRNIETNLDLESLPLKLGPSSRGGSLEELVLELILKDESVEVCETQRPVIEAGTVVWLGSMRCRVELPTGMVVDCRIASHLAARQQTDVAVGDQVWITGDDPPWVEKVEPRKTKLSRPDPDNAHIERVVAANIDVVVVVVSVVAPPLHPRILDRYLVAIEYGGAKPLICVNKLDLLPEGWERDAELSQLSPYIELGIPVVCASTTSHEGIEDLKAHLAGKLCVFVGHSGVGKSSLINSLFPELSIATGSVSEGYGRGTHTTTASTLHRVGEGIRIIDTPGVRSFGLWDMDRRDLHLYFSDFRPHEGSCKYNDCSHTHEPKCGIKSAVEKGLISPERYDAYLRLFDGL